MRSSYAQRTILAAVLLATGVTASFADQENGGLAGRVTTSTTPLAQARVYAYQMSDLSLLRVDTDNVGSFLFQELPAGLYKIIAIKVGFVPAVVLLSRDTPETKQYLEVDLAPRSAQAGGGRETFWSLRQRIPKDVLRDLETLEMAASEGSPGGAVVERAALEETSFETLTGTDDAAGQGGGSSRNRLALAGTVGQSEFDLIGDVWVARSSETMEDPSHAAALSLSLNNPGGSRIRLTTIDNRLTQQNSNYTSVDLERYQVSWSQTIGSGVSELLAEFVDQSNFYSAGPVQPMGVPLASRSWNVLGSYSGDLTTTDSLKAGFRYRQFEDQDMASSGLLPGQRVDLYGTGSTRVNPRIVVEYGLYSTLRDGSLSLAPRGGVVVELGSDWTASTLASHKVHQDDPATLYDFTPVAFRGNGSCQGEDYCYQLQLTRGWSDDQQLSIGAMHRRFSETLRLYFNDDFFSHLESLYLVDGDTLPEVQFGMTSRISPRILARLESSIAAGGGGILYTTDQNSYENNVRYLVTSLDTQFERTDTGVFLAFHHLEQELDSFSGKVAGPGLQMQRLQLMLTQDLKALNLASLALRLKMEVARGATGHGATDEDELHKRVMGGVAVTF